MRCVLSGASAKPEQSQANLIDSLCNHRRQTLPAAMLSGQRIAARMVAGTPARHLGLSTCMSVLIKVSGGRGQLLKEDGALAGVHGTMSLLGLGWGP